jgi:hypothetical protein
MFQFVRHLPTGRGDGHSMNHPKVRRNLHIDRLAGQQSRDAAWGCSADVDRVPLAGRFRDLSSSARKLAPCPAHTFL